jgi:hypothetical protein
LWVPGTQGGSPGLLGGAEGIRTDGHRGRGEISSYLCLRVNARTLFAAGAFSITIDALASGALFCLRHLVGGRLAIRWIEVDAAATQPTQEGFLS